MATCPAPLWADVTRITKLDNCGRPVYGPCSVVVTDSYTQIQYTREIEEGTDFTRRKANGQVCRSRKAPDTLKWWNMQIDFCALDPSLFSMINDKVRPIYDYRGEITGWAGTYDIASSISIAIETWLELDDPGDVCEGDTAQGAWGYDLMPRIVNARLADKTYGEDFTMSIVGISARGVRWGRGPYDVVMNPGDPVPTPGPLLEPLSSDQADYWDVVTVPPPDPSCGCQPLSNPAAPALTVTCVGTDPNGMTVQVTTAATTGDWTLDWGDGSPTETLPTGTTGATHVYPADRADDSVWIGVWDTAQPTMYRAVQVSLPCTADLVLSVDPTTGTAPLAVTWNTTGDLGAVTFNSGE